MDDEDFFGSGGFLGEEDMFFIGFSVEFDIYLIVLVIFIIVFNVIVIIFFICNCFFRIVINFFFISFVVSDFFVGLVGIFV